MMKEVLFAMMKVRGRVGVLFRGFAGNRSSISL
jgi:hypothetical protein